MEIGLGTVQFGADYGISNPHGKTTEAEVGQILESAAAGGIRVLDTAASYGDSEAVLGRCIPEDSDYRIVTKTPAFRCGEITRTEVGALIERFDLSLKYLNRRAVYGLLIHDLNDLFAPGGEALYREMEKLKTEGKVKKIGASVYTAEQIEQLLKLGIPDLVQLPVNVFDQRLPKQGTLKKLKDLGVEIHVRSAFLQGLLVMPLESIPNWFLPIRNTLETYHRFIREQGLSVIQAALQYLHQLNEVDVVLMGVNSMSQLQDNLKEIKELGSKAAIDFDAFSIDDESMINPALWQI